MLNNPEPQLVEVKTKSSKKMSTKWMQKKERKVKSISSKPDPKAIQLIDHQSNQSILFSNCITI